MGGLIPLGDASRRPSRLAVVTVLIIVVNAFVFFQELARTATLRAYTGRSSPSASSHGHRAITLLTSMFMHAGWMHIIGNMIYLWAFGRAIEDAMGIVPVSGLLPRRRHGGHVRPGDGRPMFHGSLPRRQRSHRRRHGRIHRHFSARPHPHPALVSHLLPRHLTSPPSFLIGFWFLIQVFNVGAVAQVRTGGVAYLAHIAGFLFGVVTARFFVNPNRIYFRRAT